MDNTTDTPAAMTTLTTDKLNDTPAAMEQKAPPARPTPLAPPSSFKSPPMAMSPRRTAGPVTRTAESPTSPVELPTPEVDQSFMRWSTASEAFSDADLSTWSYNPKSAIPTTAVSRDSRGASVIGPDSATSKTDLGPAPEGRSSFDTFGAGRQPSARDVSGDSVVSGASKSFKPRPMSMSSVSGSLYHGALAELGKFDDDVKDEDKTSKRAQGPSKQESKLVTDRQITTQHLGSCPPRDYEEKDQAGQAAFSLSPPPRGHRSAASVPLAELSDIREPNSSVHRVAVHSPRHRTRSKSIDTVSVHPSISDSVTGLLLPTDQNIGRIPLVHPSTLPAELVSKNELNPDQRAILLRRAKKLEQLLGQSLDERSIERLLIDPIHQVRTITTRADEEIWPSTPIGERQEGEWQRDDCVPRKGKQVDASMPGLARSGSVLAKRARAALGLDGKSKSAPRGDLAVYVSREMRVSETAVRGVKPVRNSISSPPAAVLQHDIKRNMPTSPKSILDDIDEDIGEDEVLRRKKRLQLAKLHRLLGVHVPLNLVLPQSQSQSQTYDQGHVSSESTRVDDSFMSFDDGGGSGSTNWTTKLKSAVNAVRPSREGTPISQPPTPETPQEDTCVDMMDVMTDKEKAVARKKAQKLEYMFGDAPPQNLFLPLRPSTPSVTTQGTSVVDNSDQQSSHGPYETYERSLKELLYLADNDPPSLDQIMDQLDDTLPGSTLTRRKTISPKSPSTSMFATSANVPDPDSYDARRKRTGKLSHFFGETGIDFTHPPGVEDTMDKVRTQQKRSSMRRETLDSMMREMWKGVQGEVKRGSMAIPDGEKLGEMIERLRKRRSSAQWEVL